MDGLPNGSGGSNEGGQLLRPRSPGRLEADCMKRVVGSHVGDVGGTQGEHWIMGGPREPVGLPCIGRGERDTAESEGYRIVRKAFKTHARLRGQEGDGAAQQAFRGGQGGVDRSS